MEKKHISKEHGRESVERGFLVSWRGLHAFGGETHGRVVYHIGVDDIEVKLRRTQHVKYDGGIAWFRGGKETHHGHTKVVEVVYETKKRKKHARPEEVVLFAYTGEIKHEQAHHSTLNKNGSVVTDPADQVIAHSVIREITGKLEKKKRKKQKKKK